MRVVHLNTDDVDGGAARDAMRLHHSLRAAGHDSRMLVVWKRSQDRHVRRLSSRPWLHAADRLARALAGAASLPDAPGPASLLLLQDPWVRQADVLQLHNLHGGTSSPWLLPALARRAPLVLRLADMWPFTGHCGFSFDCERWRTGCGSCPILADYPPLRVDTTGLLWRLKRAAYARTPMTVVAPSRWMAEQARSSPLLRRFPVHVVPNGIDLDAFQPLDKRKARQQLGLNPDDAVLLFSAHWVSDRRKGAALLEAALRRLPEAGVRSLTLLVAGNGQPPWLRGLPYPMKHIGLVRDDALMATVYSAADAFALPTLADNLPNGVVESMACGTPAVAFGVGGVPELVDHLATGYLARPGDVADLARGLATTLRDPEFARGLGKAARARAEQQHAAALEARRFEAIYRGIAGAG